MEKDKQIKFSIQKRNREFICPRCHQEIEIPKNPPKDIIYHCIKCFKRINQYEKTNDRLQNGKINGNNL